MPERPFTLQSDPERDEAAGYRPISGLAVAAVSVAALTAFTVVSIAIMVGVRHRPILSPLALLLAGVGLCLALAAHWQVRRSEGTRSGLGLTRISIWVCLLALGGYGAYYFAVDSAVHKQAEAFADQFMSLLADNKPESAFRLTRPPGIQRGVPDDAEGIRKRFGAGDLHLFLQSDLARTFRTWQKKTRLEFKAPGAWEEKPDGFVVVLNYSLRTPEGQFDVAAVTQGFDDRATGRRDWQIVFPGTNLRQERRLTKLGRMCDELQGVCMRNFLRGQWVPKLPELSPEDVSTIVRIDGAVPPDGQRQKLIDEIRQPNAINLVPGSSPTRSPGMPTMYFDLDGVRIVQTVQVNVPTIDAHCPAVLTVRIVGPALTKDLLDLSGADWEKQPLVPNDDYQYSILAEPKYGFKVAESFKVVELNLRPDLPRITPAPPGS